MCRAANEGDGGAIKVMIAKLANEDFLHKVLGGYKRDSVVVVDDYLLGPRFHKEYVEELLDNRDARGWTKGQKLADGQWRQAVAELRNDLAHDLFNHWEGEDAIIVPFVEDKLLAPTCEQP
jgi:hypothetical protein